MFVQCSAKTLDAPARRTVGLSGLRGKPPTRSLKCARSANCSIRREYEVRSRSTVPEGAEDSGGSQKNGLMPSESDQRRHDEAHFGRLEVTGVKSGAGCVCSQTVVANVDVVPIARTSGSSSSIGRARGRLMPNHLRSS